jgi:hypothetical protein
MPTFQDVVPHDYAPTDACRECFNKAAAQHAKEIKDADAATHITVTHSFGPFDWTTTRSDEQQYTRLKDDADHNYESALRGCMKDFPRK